MKEKVWQIPDEGPGIIVLPTDNNLIFITHKFGYIISEIEQAITKEPKLFCAALTFVYGISNQNAASAFKIGDHSLISHTKEDGATELALIIRNPSCKAKLNQQTIEKVERAFVY